jgi:hypothetical protein
MTAKSSAAGRGGVAILPSYFLNRLDGPGSGYEQDFRQQGTSSGNGRSNELGLVLLADGQRGLELRALGSLILDQPDFARAGVRLRLTVSASAAGGWFFSSSGSTPPTARAKWMRAIEKAYAASWERA